MVLAIALKITLLVLPIFLAYYIGAIASKDPYLFSKDFNADEIARLSADKTIIVTGANAGLGYGTTKTLIKANTAKVVIMGCRHMGKCEVAKKRILREVQNESEEYFWLKTALIPIELDLSSKLSIWKFTKKAQGAISKATSTNIRAPLDILINNAGIAGAAHEIMEETETDIQFHVNHMGHFALTSYLQENLISAKGRVVSVSSLAGALSPKLIDMMYSFLPEKFQSIPYYSTSKRANILFTYGLIKRFGDQFEAVIAHPGYTRTTLTRNWSFAPKFVQDFMSKNTIGSMDKEYGALSQLRAALDVETVTQGRYVGPLFGMFGKPVIVGNTVESLHHMSVSDKEADDLWALSEKAFGTIF